MPREEREVIELTEEIGGFLRQSNISKKNIARLRVLSQIQNEEVAGLAAVVLEVELMQSHRRRRLKMLARERPGRISRTGHHGGDHWRAPSCFTISGTVEEGVPARLE